MSTTKALSACFELLHHSGAIAAARPLLAGRGVIFCLHHVLPGGGLQSGFAPNARLEITPEFLAEVIRLMHKLDYECLSLDDALERLAANRGGRRFAVFTLDDGYKDNAEHAFPVFKQFNCPFTIYASPRIAEGTCELWWRGLEAIISQNANIAVSLNGQTIDLPTATDAEKWAAWKLLLPRVQVLPEQQQRDWIKQACDQHGVDLYGICRRAAMTWDALRAINQQPLATIGAHTVHHHNLLKLETKEAAREIEESGLRIEAELGEPVRHFAYPYGNVDAAGPREFELCAKAGYRSAVTTRLGPVVAGHAQHLHALPRVMVSGRFQKPRYIEALVSGLPPLMFNKGKRIHVN